MFDQSVLTRPRSERLSLLSWGASPRTYSAKSDLLRQVCLPHIRPNANARRIWGAFHDDKLIAQHDPQRRADARMVYTKEHYSTRKRELGKALHSTGETNHMKLAVTMQRKRGTILRSRVVQKTVPLSMLRQHGRKRRPRSSITDNGEAPQGKLPLRGWKRSNVRGRLVCAGDREEVFD